MKKINFIFLLIPFWGLAQVGINTTSPNAMLDIRSSNQSTPSNNDGLLIPKIDNFPTVNPTISQQGMLVYLTTTSGSNTPGFYYWNNSTTSWLPVSGSAINAWNINGNTGITNSNFIGTLNNADVNFRRGNSKSGVIAIDNTSFGINSLTNNTTTGVGNVALGNYAMENSTTGDFNTAVGYDALSFNTTGNNNVAVGYGSLLNNNSNANVAIGFEALRNSTGSGSTAIGFNSLRNSNGFTRNTAVGAQSSQNTTSGDRNTSLGWASLNNNTTGSDNIAIGHLSLSGNNTANNNIAIGNSAMSQNSTGRENTSIGNSSMVFNSTGFLNTSVGYRSLTSNTTGNYNSSFGQSMISNTTGSSNSAFGFQALNANTTGNNNSALGFQAFSTGANFSNSSALGANSVITASNQVRVGNNTVTSIGGFVNWTNVSDARFKRDIKNNVPGLSFISKLKPVTYKLDNKAIAKYLNNDELSSGEDRNYTGFIAQDVEKAANDLGFNFSGIDKPKNENDYYGLRYAEFVVPLVKAMQEQQTKIEELEERLKLLEQKFNN